LLHLFIGNPAQSIPWNLAIRCNSNSTDTAAESEADSDSDSEADAQDGDVPPALIDPAEVKLRNAVAAFEKANENFSDDVARDCHVIHLDHEGDDGRPSHSSAYSCYQSDKPMDDALTALKGAAFDAGRTFPEALAKLKAMLDDDVAYFAVGLADYEK
jgi:hypothetical protein